MLLVAWLEAERVVEGEEVPENVEDTLGLREERAGADRESEALALLVPDCVPESVPLCEQDEVAEGQ